MSESSALEQISSPDIDWQRLHDVWYRRWYLCEMRWPDRSTRLEGCLVAASNNGGPIATVRDSKMFQPSRGSSTSELQIFTAGGEFIASCPWTFDQLVTMQWTPDEILVCIFKNGVVRVFSVFCEVLYCFYMDQRLKKEDGIVAAIIAPEGVIVVLTGTLKLFANLTFSQPDCIRLADVPLTSPPCCIKTIPTSTSSRSIQEAVINPLFPNKASSAFAVLVASESSHLYLVDQVRCVQLPVADGPFPIISISPSGRHVACISPRGALQVFNSSSDFSRPLDKAVLRCSGRPRQVCWVGEDCLAYYVVVPTPTGAPENFLFVGGPNNEWLPYQFGSDVLHLVSEIDGLKVIGSSASYFIHRVARSTSDILSVGSCRPAAMLVYACSQYSSGNSLVNDAMKAVLPELPSAISFCIDAAEREIDPGRIAMLLKSAVFGRLFLKDYVYDYKCRAEKAKTPASGIVSFADNEKTIRRNDELAELQRLQSDISEQYLKAIRDLRIAMALRSLPAEILITIAQLRGLGPALLMRILAQRRLHLMALRIGEWLGLGQPRRIVKIYDVIQEDCSKELRDVCSYFWESPGVQGLTDIAGQSDVTRPTGVALALPSKQPLNRAGGQRRGMLSHLPAIVCGTHVASDLGSKSPMCFVLEHWAKEKISASVEKTDMELLTIIRDVLGQYPNIQPQMTQIALWAARFSRPSLATLLLQFEPRSRVQIRILLRLAEVDLAIKQAVTVGDADLIVECLSTIAGEIPDEQGMQKLVEVLNRFPLLWDYFGALCDRSNQSEMIQRLHERADKLGRAGYDCILRSLRDPDIEKKKALVAHASGFFASARNAGQKWLKVTQQLSLEYVELVNLQKQLEQKAVAKNWQKPQCKLINLSLAQTIKELYMRRQAQEATKLQTLFEISAKRMLKIQVEALLEINAPDEVVVLGQLSNNQKIVGGVEYFIRALDRTGNQSAAARFLPSLAKNTTAERMWFARLFPQSSDLQTSTDAGGRLATAAGSLMGSLFSRQS